MKFFLIYIILESVFSIAFISFLGFLDFFLLSFGTFVIGILGLKSSKTPNIARLFGLSLLIVPGVFADILGLIFILFPRFATTLSITAFLSSIAGKYNFKATNFNNNFDFRYFSTTSDEFRAPNHGETSEIIDVEIIKEEKKLK